MATIPAGYTQGVDGQYYYTDGTGPYAIDATGPAVIIGSGGGGGGGGAVTGGTSHDAAAAAVKPVLLGGYASAAAPANVSADGDAVDAWFLRNGAQAQQATFSGVLASTGSGVNGTGVQRVSIATDDVIIASLATKLDTLHADLNATNAQLPAGLGSLAAAASLAVTASTEDIARIGIITETAPATDTASSGLNGRLQRIAQRITSLIALLPAALGQGTSAQGLRVVLPNDQAGTAQPTITRPANTTAYSAGDVVGGAITFATGLTSGQHAMITGADLQYQISAIPSGMTSFRLYLYDVTPPSAIADNAAWDFASADRSAFLGYIDLGSLVDLGTTCFCQVDNVNKKIKLNGSANLFGYLVTAAGYTPAANSEVILPRLQLVGV